MSSRSTGNSFRHDRGAAGRECRNQLALRPLHALERADQLEVHGPDVRDHADVRAGDPAEVGDLAEAAHRELEDADLGVGLEPAERQRDADLVVEARLRGDRAGRRRAERGEDVLRRRLAGRARDPDDARVRAVTHERAERGERLERLVREQRRRGAADERLVAELGAPADRDEQIAVLDAARVDLDAGDLLGVRVQLAERRQLVERAAGSRGRSEPAQRLARDLAVVERDRAVGELLALLVALAGDHDHVAFAGLADSAGDRLAPVRLDLGTVGALEDLGDDRLGLLAARIVGGDDRDVGELGRRSGPSAAACRGRGRRRSRRRRSRGSAPGRAPCGGRSRASPACGRSRRAPRTAAPRRPPRSGPGTPAQFPDAVGDRVVRDLQQARRRDRAEHVLDVEAAAQSRLELDSARAETRATRPELELVGAELGVVREPEGEQLVPAAQLLREPPAVLVADVDGSGGTRLA